MRWADAVEEKGMKEKGMRSAAFGSNKTWSEDYEWDCG